MSADPPPPARVIPADRAPPDGLELYEYAVGKHGVQNLKPFLAAMHEKERWQALSGTVGALLVFLGAPCWVMAAWPGLVHGQLRAFFLSVWAALFVLLIASLVAARVWQGRCARYRVAPGDSPRPE